MTFWFQGNNYANEHEMRRRFHHQLFSCRSDFEETRHVSLNPTTPLAFIAKVTSRQQLDYNMIIRHHDITTKLLLQEKGVSPG